MCLCAFPEAQMCSCYIVTGLTWSQALSLGTGLCTPVQLIWLRALTTRKKALLPDLPPQLQSSENLCRLYSCGDRWELDGAPQLNTFLQSNATWITKSFDKQKSSTFHKNYSTKIHVNWRKQLQLTRGKRQRSKQNTEFSWVFREGGIFLFPEILKFQFWPA